MMDKWHTLQELIDLLPDYGDRLAVLALHQEGGMRWSYVKLAGSIHQLAVGLSQIGLGQGATAALLASNRPEWIMAALAVIRAGAVVVPLDVQLGDDGLIHMLKDSEARFIFTTQDQARRLDDLAAGLDPTFTLPTTRWSAPAWARSGGICCRCAMNRPKEMGESRVSTRPGQSHSRRCPLKIRPCWKMWQPNRSGIG